jgi:hypothetical protein
MAAQRGSACTVWAARARRSEEELGMFIADLHRMMAEI